MSDVTVKNVEDLEYDREGGVQLRHAAKELGLTAFGMEVIDLEPRLPSAEERGPEAVYVVLRGTAMLHVGNQHHELVPGVLARVGKGESRRLEAGPDGATVLAIGAAAPRP